MLDHGHPDARDYPVCEVFAEARRVVKRLDAQLATEIGLMQMALSTIPNMNVKGSHTKRAAVELVKTLKAMRDGN